MRKTYDKAFKIEIASQIVAKKTTVSAVASEYKISRPIVSRWVSEFNRYGNQAFSGKGKRLPDKAKQYALEEEVKRLKEENEILKKFAAFVAQEKK
ncbi:MAG TPA: transposase [Erysipelothrix sp.]|nr:transposase [Erysipelothrix sp.]